MFITTRSLMCSLQHKFCLHRTSPCLTFQSFTVFLNHVCGLTGYYQNEKKMMLVSFLLHQQAVANPHDTQFNDQ